MNANNNVDPQRMRAIMGNFCSGITIITANTEAGLVGFTCQSFSSLSLEPPLITFNPARSSTSWPKIREAASFCVNILDSEQEQLSRTFARPGTDKFANVAYRNSAMGNPILADALAWVDCTLYAEYDGGDHTIVVGEVEEMHAREAANPLVFFRGGYVSLEKAKVEAH